MNEIRQSGLVLFVFLSVACDGLENSLEGTSWSMSSSSRRSGTTVHFSQGIISLDNGAVLGAYEVLGGDEMRVKFNREGYEFIVSVVLDGSRMTWYRGKGEKRKSLYYFTRHQ